jgi:hypothetical protein
MAKAKKQDELEQQIGELTQDLQRTRADFLSAKVCSIRLCLRDMCCSEIIAA